MNVEAELIDFMPARFTDSRLYTAHINGRKWLVKVYVNNSQELRYGLERSKLLRWKEAGFCVPEVIDISLKAITQPYLVIEYLDGINFSDYLRNKSIPWLDKQNILNQIFRSNRHRHELALQTGDARLIHTDPNTDNIILIDKKFFYIDFEHPSSISDIETAVAAEIATFTRRMLNDIGRDYIEEVVTMLMQAYSYHEKVFSLVESMTLKRSFQFIHRLKDHHKKRKNSNLVTRYDVADAIHRLRKNHLASAKILPL